MIGLGTFGYISTGQFQSSMLGITSNISSMIDPIELASTITGLGTIGFVSSIGLTNIMNSTVIGLNTYIAAAIDPIELASSIVGLGTMGFISSIGFDAKFGSTVQGLGTAGYLSSFNNLSTLSTLNLNVSSINGQTFGGPIQSTAIGLGTLGYISSYQLFSTVTALTGSTLSLSAGSIFVSSLQGFKISTAQTMVCTITFQDQTANNPMGNVYQYSSVLYYNSYVVAGTTAMNIQSFTF
jgi:hypothetical protein